MGSVLAIVNKAMFERELSRAGIKPSSFPPPSSSSSSDAPILTLDIDRYISRGPGLAPLRDGGTLVLVTVRRREASESVWLVAILERPKLTSDGYVSRRTNVAPLTDVTELMREFLQADGGKLPVAGRLAMSLQTPRSMHEGWVNRFREAARTHAPPPSIRGEGRSAMAHRAPEVTLASRAALPDLLRDPPWTRRLPARPGVGREVFGTKTGALGRRREPIAAILEWPDHSRELALGMARMRKCQHWRDATFREVDAALNRPGKITGTLRVCIGVLSTLPEDEALEVAERVSFSSLCHQTSLLLPALARLGAPVAPLVAKAALSSERRHDAFRLLAHVGTPLAVPAVLDVMTRAPTYRLRARLWLVHFAPATLPVLVPIAAGVVASELGLGDFVPQKTAESLRRAATRALWFMAASSTPHRDLMVEVARTMRLEGELQDVLETHPLTGRGKPEMSFTQKRDDAPARDLVRPILRGSQSTALDTGAFLALLELLALNDWAMPSEDIDAVEAALEPESLAAFLESLLTKWIASRATRRERWVADAVCQMAEGVLLPRVVDLVRSWRSSYRVPASVPLEAIGRAAVVHPSRTASDRALSSLGALSMKGGAHGAAIKKTIDQVAASLGVSREALGDRIVSRLGLDERGVMRFEVGDQTLEARLDAQLSPHLVDVATHKRLKEFPRVARRGMRAMKTNEEREAERWTTFRAECKVMAQQLTAHVETWLTERHRWTLEDFRAHVLGHPLLRHVAFGLVWGVYEEHDRRTDTFRVTEDLSFASIEDELFEVGKLQSKRQGEEARRIGVVHPAELDDRTLARWADVLFDYEIVPIVPQLAWPVIRLSEAEQRATMLDPRPHMQQQRLNGNDIARLWQKRWTEGPKMPVPPGGSPDTTLTYEKRVVSAAGARSSKSEGSLGGAKWLRVVMTLVNDVSFTRSIVHLRVQRFRELGDGGWLPWRVVDPVSVSELLLELSHLNGR